MASDRDTLAQALAAGIETWVNRSWLVLPGPTDIGPELAGHLAKELADWRPPAREITTLDDLLALPVGTVVRSSAGTITCRADLRRGVVFGDDRPFEWIRLALPATVIPIATEEASRG